MGYILQNMQKKMPAPQPGLHRGLPPGRGGLGSLGMTQTNLATSTIEKQQENAHWEIKYQKKYNHTLLIPKMCNLWANHKNASHTKNFGDKH